MPWDLAGIAIDSAGITGGTELAPGTLRRYSDLSRLAARDLLAHRRRPRCHPWSSPAGALTHRVNVTLRDRRRGMHPGPAA